MDTRPLEEFDIHEINRLIQREQIPGFQMLPKEKKYLEEYREVLRQLYVGEQGKQHEVKRQIVPNETSSEMEVTVKTTKRTSRKSKSTKSTKKTTKNEE